MYAIPGARCRVVLDRPSFAAAALGLGFAGEGLLVMA
jgi:hypothetical protein